MDKREQSEYYAELAQELIDTEPLLQPLQEVEFTIIYLVSKHKKKSGGMTIHGETEKVQDKNKWAIPGDCTITIYEENNVGMTEEQLRILMFHELLHIEVSEDYKSFKIRQHNVQDFREIIDRFGMDWAHVDGNMLPGQITMEDIDGKAKEEE